MADQSTLDIAELIRTLKGDAAAMAEFTRLAGLTQQELAADVVSTPPPQFQSFEAFEKWR